MHFIRTSCFIKGSDKFWQDWIVDAEPVDGACVPSLSLPSACSTLVLFIKVVFLGVVLAYSIHTLLLCSILHLMSSLFAPPVGFKTLTFIHSIIFCAHLFSGSRRSKTCMWGQLEKRERESKKMMPINRNSLHWSWSFCFSWLSCLKCLDRQHVATFSSKTWINTPPCQILIL